MDDRSQQPAPVRQALRPCTRSSSPAPTWSGAGPDEIQAGLARDAAVTLGRAPGAPRRPPHRRRRDADLAARRAAHRRRPAAARRAARRRRAGSPWVRHTLAALARRAPDRLRAQPRAPAREHLVAVSPFGHPLSRDAGRRPRGAVPARGTAPPRPRAGRDRRHGPRSSRSPCTCSSGSASPPVTSSTTGSATAVPHLVVRLVEGRAVVGPFVVPGRTACLRCIDAYLTEEDPAWPLLVEQYARVDPQRPLRRHPRAGRRRPRRGRRRLGGPRPGGVRRGRAPAASWSSTVTISRRPRRRSPPRHWPPHPHCGCAWG